MDKMLPTWFRLFLGVAEVAAAIGLILPGITRIMPRLVPLAAAGIMLVMVSATILHATRPGEMSSAMTTAVLLVISTFVAYMRWKVKPIQPRAVA